MSTTHVQSVTAMVTVAFTTFPLLAGMGCAGSRDQGVRGVHALLDRLIAADNAGDVASIVTCYTEDAVLLPPSGPAIHGRESIRKQYEEGFRHFSLEITVDEHETQAANEWAFSRGQTVGRRVWRDGKPPTPIQDKYLMILAKRPSGDWAVSSLMWSPVQEAPTDTPKTDAAPESTH